MPVAQLNAVSQAAVSLCKSSGQVIPYHGTSDATRGAALTAALAAYASGDAILLGPGTYNTSTAKALPAGCFIRGFGRKTVVTPGFTVATDIDNITLQDLKITGCLTFSGNSLWPQLHRVEVDATGQTNGIVAVGSLYGLRMSDCDVYGAVAAGCSLPCCRYSTLWARDCRFHNNGTWGLYLGPSTGESPPETTDEGFLISGSRFSKNGTGGLFVEEVHDGTISACRFEGNLGYGVRLDAPCEIIIADSTFEENFNVSYKGADIKVNLRNSTGGAFGQGTLKIVSNHFQGGCHAIVFDGVASTTKYILEVYNNDIQNMQLHAIVFGDPGDGIVAETDASYHSNYTLHIQDNSIYNYAAVSVYGQIRIWAVNGTAGNFSIVNNFIDCNNAGTGICVIDNAGGVVSGNVVKNSPQYGIWVAQVSGNPYLDACHGNAFLNVTTPFYRTGSGAAKPNWDNISDGATTKWKNSGTATISSGNTITGAITHGLAGTPTAQDFVVANANGSDGSGLAYSYWVSDITSTTFKINCHGTPDADTSLVWSAELRSL